MDQLDKEVSSENIPERYSDEEFHELEQSYEHIIEIIQEIEKTEIKTDIICIHTIHNNIKRKIDDLTAEVCGIPHSRVDGVRQHTQDPEFNLCLDEIYFEEYSTFDNELEDLLLNCIHYVEERQLINDLNKSEEPSQLFEETSTGIFRKISN